ncbi:MAG: ParA family protein [Clostridia bacterium]|nr:ParA family protein [Oscillospiraceae bacterium]MBQ6796557.1 ParA family protein [Clostridia bacterium]
MGKIIAVANQKGGVGKTTTSVNLTSALGELGKKCLLVDIDPQGNATSGMGIEKKRGKEASSYELILGEVAANSLIIETEFKNVWIIPASMELAGAELELVNVEYRERRLKMALAAAREKFDFILIDCPPSLGLITINALTAADSVIVPIQCEYYALEGLSQLTNTVSKVKRLYNEQLETEGVLMTMYDSRLNLTQEVAAQVKKFFPRQVFKTVIPRAVRLSEAPSFGQPINYFDKRSKGADAYRSLAKEIIKKNRK